MSKRDPHRPELKRLETYISADTYQRIDFCSQKMKFQSRGKMLDYAVLAYMDATALHQEYAKWQPVPMQYGSTKAPKPFTERKENGQAERQNRIAGNLIEFRDSTNVKGSRNPFKKQKALYRKDPRAILHEE